MSPPNGAQEFVPANEILEQRSAPLSQDEKLFETGDELIAVR
jgi:hypothetical protein